MVDQIARELDRFDGVVARLARELVGRCADLNRQITGLERELQTLVRQLAPSLLAVRGCGVLSAAVLVGETAGVERFKSKTTSPGSPAPHPSQCGQVPARARCGSTVAGTG